MYETQKVKKTTTTTHLPDLIAICPQFMACMPEVDRNLGST